MSEVCTHTNHESDFNHLYAVRGRGDNAPFGLTGMPGGNGSKLWSHALA